jgi:hypothetical protein
VRVRGLKLPVDTEVVTSSETLAPRAGAWVETCYATVGAVAPRAGAWVETPWSLC